MSANILKNLISSNLNMKNVYAYSINSGNVSLTDPVFLVTEILKDPTNYGGDRFNSMNEELQVQIYYPKETTIDVDSLEDNFLNLLQENKYRPFDISGHVYTPDNQTIVITYKFNHVKEVA
ncbi:DUF806 family protein [Pediococcus ethanolidurans]|uniref:DUF806 family protein n=1 Tax=Pediococcus ethanolidurans TaxID=319653 RepID=UPI0021E7DD92|nr:DUF806 family protein [Pediococcus ethanolidurans]MCV3320812.1 DUF806 family protein [Pediococcus ethanolidurans]